jgi:hypothetical protein
MLTRVYGYSVKSLASDANIYEDQVWNMRLTMFKKVLHDLDDQIRLIPEVFEVVKSSFTSQRLRNLCSLRKVTVLED